MSESNSEALLAMENAPIEEVRRHTEASFVRGNFGDIARVVRQTAQSKDEEKRKLAEEYARRITPDFVVLCFLVFLVMVFAAVSLSYLPR